MSTTEKVLREHDLRELVGVDIMRETLRNELKERFPDAKEHEIADAIATVRSEFAGKVEASQEAMRIANELKDIGDRLAQSASTQRLRLVTKVAIFAAQRAILSAGV